MFCKECGNQIGENHKFCEYCGTPVDDVKPIQPVEYHTEANEQPTTGLREQVIPPMNQVDGNQKKKSKAPIIIGIVGAVLFVAIIVAVVVGAVFFVRKGNTGGNEPVKSTETQVAETQAPQQTETPEVTETTESEPEPVVLTPEEAFGEFANTLTYVNLEGVSYRHERQENAFAGFPLENASGVFKTKILDLDHDGVQELLTFQIVQNLEAETPCSDIHAVIYEYDGTNVVQTADAVVVTGAFKGYDDIAGIRIALKDNYYICIDYTCASFLETDGGCIDMELWKYDGSALVSMAQLQHSGSDWTDATEYCADIKPQLEEAGLSRTIEQVYTYGIFSFSMAETGMQAICKIYADTDNDDPYAEGVTVVNTVLHFVDENPETDFYFADSNCNPIDDATLSALSKEELRIARNEIYARYSWKFDDQNLQSYFETKAWYLQPYCGFEIPGSKILTEVEKGNTEKIKELEK